MIPPTLLFLGGASLAALFLAFPMIDLWASRYFFDPDKGFVLLGNPVFDWLHSYLDYFAWFMLFLCLAYILLANWRFAPTWLTGRRKQAIYVLLALLLGPGLLVNTLFKDQWGRARPMDVREFHGTRDFTPAWVISGQCAKNCSFVCGDASLGFGVIALAFVSRRPRRWLIAGMALGAGLGLMRMAQGGHFLSDVVFSFFVVYFAAWLLHRWLYPVRSDQAGNQAVISR